jgi:hypothetical protein
MQTVLSFLWTERVVAACLFLSVGAWGCGGSTRELNSPDSLILYSIDGMDSDHKESKYPESVERFHGYPVLGKIEIVDSKQRSEIAEAVKAGIKSSDGTMNKCFWPRHALRVTQSGKTIDYVICFECLQLKIHRGDEEERLATADTPQMLLNTILQEANIKLPPPPTEE